MSEPSSPFSLLDAARVVARGGTFDAKLRALSEQARDVAEGGQVAILLHDPDAAALVSLDGSVTISTADDDADLMRAIGDRVPVALSSVPEALAPLLRGAESSLLSPLVVEDEEGAFVEGVLIIGWESDEPPADAASAQLLAISDLVAVAIRQARLRNTAWENSDHADRLLHTDRLTGLANRVTFERMLELEIARATRQGTSLAVAVMAIDDPGGHQPVQGGRVADEILRHVAAAIADRVRLLDTVARFGDGEFVVIAPGDAGGLVAMRLREAISELPPVGDIDISVSVAVVHHPADGTTGAELVATAESALAEAKSSGPGSVLGVREATV
jgi:diguanylate cyclase (GGDEF)-like protein